MNESAAVLNDLVEIVYQIFSRKRNLRRKILRERITAIAKLPRLPNDGDGLAWRRYGGDTAEIRRKYGATAIGKCGLFY